MRQSAVVPRAARIDCDAYLKNTLAASVQLAHADD